MSNLGENIKKLGFGLMRLPPEGRRHRCGADEGDGRSLYEGRIYLL